MNPASSYPHKQTSEGLTIAAIPYPTPEQVRTVFGKLNLLEYGVLPVLIVMQNSGGKALRLDQMEIQYITSEGRSVNQTPAGDVQYLEAPKRPNFGGSPFPNPLPRKTTKKNKLAAPEIEGYALNARMLPAGESAHGFVYFQALHRPGARIYLRGIAEAASGKEFLFFEIPLE